MQIVREELMKTFSEYALAESGVVIGPPGVGKTHLLRDFCKQLINKNIPNLYLPIDKLGANTEVELKAELDINNDFIDYLRSQNLAYNSRLGVLVIDALDAARSLKAQSFFLNLIHRVKKELQGQWNVIVSVRTYDARKSEDLQQLFPILSRVALPRGFQTQGIHCRHFSIPKLTDDEVRATVGTIARLPHIYDNGSADFRELLRIPFNLWLLEKLLSSNLDISELSSVSSEVQLLELYWKYRVLSGPLGEDKRFFLTKTTQAMVRERSLSIRAEEVYVIGESAVWDSLLGAEVLIPVSTTAQRIAFSHNILFDYAVSVLLIEDDPQKLIEFIAQDYSRPLFLRPSLNYFFTRLWHSAPALFWKAFWRIFPSANLNLRLLGRLLPPTVIVNEARSIEELTPLLNALAENKPYASEAGLRLMQALRMLDIDRDELWIEFLNKVSENLHQDFAWDLAMITSSILERTDDGEILQTCGKISRKLLEWIWNCREEYKDTRFDGLGAIWAVPLVAKTFGTNPQASRILLKKVLSLLEEEKFPVDFLFRLTSDLDKIIPYDSDFVAMVYTAVFGHSEYSDDKISFGSPILPMTTTRRQEYGMCQYILIQHIPAFLGSAPLQATQAVIDSLNNFILDEHVREFSKEEGEIPQQFNFRGAKAYYISDNSFIWDERGYDENPIKMADELYQFIAELASSKKFPVTLESLLDTFRDKAKFAFFWKRLLDIAAQVPEAFAHYLFELCIARPIQLGNDCIYELGKFLEAAAPYFSDDELRQIEESLLTLAKGELDNEQSKYMERKRNRLLARIPAEMLRTDAAKSLRKAMEEADDVPTNEPLSSFSFYSHPYSEEDWLKEQGVDLARSENQKLQSSFKTFNEFESMWANGIPTANAIETILPQLKKLERLIKKPINADKAVLNSSWTKLGSCAKLISRAANDPESEIFRLCRRILLQCAKHECPEPNPKYDSQFNSPSWSPAPRTEAAQGLPWLAARKPDKKILVAISALVHDKVPSVRFLVTQELSRLSDQAPETFWRLAEEIAENEINHVVLQVLCNNLGNVVFRGESKDIEKQETRVLDKMFDKAIVQDERSRLLASFISLVIGLAIVRENEWARTKLDIFLSEPSDWSKALNQAAFQAVLYITPSNIDSLKARAFAERAILWLSNAINSAAISIKELRAIPFEEWSEETRSKIRDVYGVIDQVVMRLFFAADVREGLRNNDRPPVSHEQRRNFFFKVKPLLEQILEFALDKENGLLFAPTAHYFMQLLNGVLDYDPKAVIHMAANLAESSEPSNYNLDSLAIREVVKLVESIFADYRSELRDTDTLRDLLVLLDIFAKTGSPETLLLVWRLDEVFR
jgi:hypothetical protein